jgi:integrase
MEPDEETPIAKLLSAGKLAQQTKENYILRIRAYLRRVRKSPGEFVRDVQHHPKNFEEDFVKFIGEISKSSAPSTTAFWRDSLRRFLEINRVKGVDWGYINQFLPKVTKSGQDRAPTLEEIRKIVSVADLRTECLILFLSASGARIGSVEYLRWRDVYEMELEGVKLARVIIYRGEPEEYSTFVTPECYESLLRYRETREKVGEKVEPSSPVFAREVNKRKFDQGKVGPASVSTLKNQLGELLNHMKMRGTLVEKANYRSYEWKQCHSFRKFFKTRMEMSGVKPIITEMLMGHTIGVSGSYMKPTEKELLEEYAKAIDNLTIFEMSYGRQNVKNDFHNELLLVAGFKEDEIRKMDVSKMADEEFQKTVRQKLLGTMANNGSSQKVVPLGEVDTYISKGWEFVAALPNEKAILKLPS